MKLKDVCEINMGQSPESEYYNDKAQGLPFFQGNADFGELYPSVRIWCSEPKKIAQVGDILMSVRAPIGAMNIANVVCCIGRGLASIKVRDIAFLKYIWYALKSKAEELQSKGTGSTFKAINKAVLEELEISVPSIEEQQRIADELDKVSGLIEKRQKQLEKLDLLIKSRFVEMFGDPINNTKKLCLVKLNELGEWSSGGTPSRNIAKYFLGDIDWYSAGELKELFLTGSVEKITYEAIDNSSAKLFPQGSMLIGMYDTAAFKMGILKKASASNQACACIIPNNKISIIWLYYVLQEMKAYFLLNRRGIRQKNLNLGMIKNFVIPLAGKELQNQFADFVEKVEQNKLKIKNSLDKLITLKKSLMQKYFG